MKIPLLGSIPEVGDILFRQDALVYCSFVLVPALWYFVFRTRPGLNLRALGESPATADAMGLNVVRLRYIYVILGGALAGLGGAAISLATNPGWSENMTSGRGWIAVALVIFATWNPARVALGAYLFGGVEAGQFRLQSARNPGLLVLPQHAPLSLHHRGPAPCHPGHDPHADRRAGRTGPAVYSRGAGLAGRTVRGCTLSQHER